MSTSHGSVRMGPISLFTLLVVLCLAVMAVLSVTTSQATYVLAQRQANATVALYANEAAAQNLVAHIDETLEQLRTQGQSGTQARTALEAVLPQYCVDAQRAGIDALMVAEQAQWKSLDERRRDKEQWAYLDERAQSSTISEPSSESGSQGGADRNTTGTTELFVNAHLDSAQNIMAAAGIVGTQLDIVDGVYAAFETGDGRKLEIIVGIHNDATYEILAWKSSTLFTGEGDTETFWTGESEY